MHFSAAVTLGALLNPSPEAGNQPTSPPFPLRTALIDESCFCALKNQSWEMEV